MYVNMGMYYIHVYACICDRGYKPVAVLVHVFCPCSCPCGVDLTNPNKNQVNLEACPDAPRLNFDNDTWVLINVHIHSVSEHSVRYAASCLAVIRSPSCTSLLLVGDT